MNNHGKKWNENKFKPAEGSIAEFIIDILEIENIFRDQSSYEGLDIE